MNRARVQKPIIFLSLLALAVIVQGCNVEPDTSLNTEPVTGAQMEVIHVAPAIIKNYSPPGEFSIADNIVDAPRRAAVMERPLAVMKYQVTEHAYARCVAEQACPSTGKKNAENLPVTGVNYLDAQAYARWFSQTTGQDWRLPNDLEWVHFSGKAAEQDIGVETAETAEAQDWVDKWIGQYKQEANRQRETIRRLYPIGHFGENHFGIADIGGNVWEWTQSCFERVTLDETQTVISRHDFCGIMVLQGRHRGYMPEFIRDASGGGCGVGIPPDYMGFRLVRSLRWHEVVWHKITNITPRLRRSV